MTKAIIFDCFGVVRTDSFNDVYRYFGGDPDKDREFIKKALDDSNSGKISSIRPVVAAHLGITEDEWARAMDSSGKINEELLTLTKKLRKEYKIGMLSNIWKGGLAKFFEPGFLEQYFDVIVSSGDIGFAKPEARAYEIAAEKLGTRLDECVFTDDREEYIEGAKSIGMRTILYKDFGQFENELQRILGKNRGKL